MNPNKADVIGKLICFIEKYYYFFLSLILALSLFNLFYKLGDIPIYSWDEARHGVNAYEMLKRGDYIVNTYAYENDYWNLKPPISYWAIIAGYKLVGFNPLGLRIFSSAASLITIATVALITAYKHGRLSSLIASSALATTVPFILEHCSRSGDADSIYIMFFTLAMASTILIEKNIRFLYFSGFFFSLAFLTKSWHAVNIVIIGVLFLIFNRKLLKLRLRTFILFFITTSLPILIWGALRYTKDFFTFFKTMIEFDLLARTSKSIEGHIGGPDYYLYVMRDSYFSWTLVLVSGFIVYSMLQRSADGKVNRNYRCLIALWIIVPFILYTEAKTKISWYILPVFPPISICIGAFCNNMLKTKFSNAISQYFLGILILVALFSNETFIKNEILFSSDDNVQKMIYKMGNIKQYRGKNIYSLYKTGSDDNPNRWNQSYLLCSELYGDLKPIEGDIEEFLKDATDNPLLLAPKKIDTYQFIRENGLKVVIESKDSFILTK